MRRGPASDRRPSAMAQAARGDDGLSLVEVVVAMAILTMMSVAVLRILLGGMDVSEDARQRAAASQLAAREVEVAREEFFRDAPSLLALAGSGTVTNATPLAAGGTTLDGTAYAVRRTVQWVPTGNGASACDGGTLVTHPSLRVSVAVSWDDMGATRPVTSETLLTPPKNSVANSTVVYVAVKAQNAAGLGEPGVTAVLSRSGTSLTQVTDASGCAVFQVAAAGDWDVALDTPGYVDQTGAARPTRRVTGVAGQLAVASLTYDRPAAVDVSFTAPAGHGLPSAYSPDASPAALPAISFERHNVDESRTRASLPRTGGTTRVSGLWPTTDGYSFWAGSCADSDPAAPPTSGSRSPGVAVSPGAASTASVGLAPVRVTTTRGSGAAGVGGLTVYAQNPGCGGADDEWLSLGVTDSAGVLRTSLPYGRWTIGTAQATSTVVTQPTGVTDVALTLTGTA